MTMQMVREHDVYRVREVQWNVFGSGAACSNVSLITSLGGVYENPGNNRSMHIGRCLCNSMWTHSKRLPLEVGQHPNMPLK